MPGVVTGRTRGDCVGWISAASMEDDGIFAVMSLRMAGKPSGADACDPKYYTPPPGHLVVNGRDRDDERRAYTTNRAPLDALAHELYRRGDEGRRLHLLQPAAEVSRHRIPHPAPARTLLRHHESLSLQHRPHHAGAEPDRKSVVEG